MKPKIYIAGPMRGLPNFNREAFNAAAERLAAKGWQPVNPVDIERLMPCVDDDGRVDEQELWRVMQLELEFVKRCDTIYLLNGWENSVGATMEVATLIKDRLIGLRIHLESNGTPEAPQSPLKEMLARC